MLDYLKSTKAMPLMRLEVRTTIVPVAGKRLLISPGSMLTEAQLRSAAPIDAIVAPSLLHTAGVPAAARVFPEAQLWGVPGVREKHPQLKWHGILGVDPWPWQAELPLFPLRGLPRTHETLLLHRASGSLILMDAVFNILEPDGIGARLFTRLVGTSRRLAVSRILLALNQDREALRASLKEVLAQEFDRLVPSHGEVVPSGGKEGFLKALRERGLA